jgi:hypothetical protein
MHDFAKISPFLRASPKGTSHAVFSGGSSTAAWPGGMYCGDAGTSTHHVCHSSADDHIRIGRTFDRLRTGADGHGGPAALLRFQDASRTPRREGPGECAVPVRF